MWTLRCFNTCVHRCSLSWVELSWDAHCHISCRHLAIQHVIGINSSPMQVKVVYTSGAQQTSAVSWINKLNSNQKCGGQALKIFHNDYRSMICADTLYCFFFVCQYVGHRHAVIEIDELSLAADISYRGSRNRTKFGSLKEGPCYTSPPRLVKIDPTGPVRRQNSEEFLANVNSRSRSLYAVARPSVVCR